MTLITPEPGASRFFRFSHTLTCKKIGDMPSISVPISLDFTLPHHTIPPYFYIPSVKYKIKRKITEKLKKYFYSIKKTCVGIEY